MILTMRCKNCDYFDADLSKCIFKGSEQKPDDGDKCSFFSVYGTMVKNDGSQGSNDSVNHPDHYTHGGMECIDEMVEVFGRYAVMNFCLCNVWKYRKRAMYKNGEEDMKKADWYMKKYVELKGEEK